MRISKGKYLTYESTESMFLINEWHRKSNRKKISSGDGAVLLVRGRSVERDGNQGNRG